MIESPYRMKAMPQDLAVIDSLELFAATELEVSICRLPSGEEVVVFSDCTEKSPIIYQWCLDMANEWLENRKP